jgi:hypothetical protein
MKQHTIHANGVAINDSTAVMTSTTYLDGMTVHFGVAPTTAENFVVTLDSASGAAYDTVLFRRDPATPATTDIYWAETLKLVPGDALKTTYTNTDARVIGVTFRLR